MIPALFLALFTGYAAAQTIAVDMDTASGIQATASSRDTAQLLTMQVRIIGAVNLFSYQYKIAFDDTKLSYISAQLDGGPLGEKNVLTRNGGVTLGLCQLQLNPPASDTIEISGTITGTDPALSVSGDGLIGVIYFKSKTAFNDSSAISASNGFTALYSGDMSAIQTYTAGNYRVLPSVALSPDRFNAMSTGGASNGRAVTVTIGTTVAVYNLGSLGADATTLTFRLLTPDGKCVANYMAPYAAATGRLSVPLSRITAPLSAGVYIGSIGFNGRTVSRTIRLQ